MRVHEVLQDVRYALRLWRRRPMAAAFSVALLSLAIGANAGVFSVIDALLLRSLPFDAPDRLAAIRNYAPPRDTFHEWRRRSPYLSDAATYDTFDVNVEGVREASRLILAETSWNFFSLLGARPAAGRTFAEGEDSPGRNGVAIIGYGVWRRLFGEDPSAIGSTLRVNGTVLTIIGVAPRGFDFPDRAELWTPTTFDYERIPKTGSVTFFRTIGRLQPSLAWSEVRAAFAAEAASVLRARPPDPAYRPALLSLQEQLAGPVRRASLIFMAAAALLLLLACANVGSLLLARTAARTGELAIRASLGARRARLTRQLFTESVLMAAIATAAGLLVARWTADLAAVVQPAALSAQSYTVLGWRVLLFAASLSLATAVLFGVSPALHLHRIETATSRTVTASGRYARTRSVLIGAQVAVTIVLLSGALSLGRAFLRLLRADSGYQTRSMVTLSASVAGSPYEGKRAWAFFDQLLARIGDVPGVIAASGAESLPLSTAGFMVARFRVDGQGPTGGALVVPVAPGFFGAIGGRVIAGREFSRADLSSVEQPVVVNDVLARAFGDPADVVGRTLTGPPLPAMRIVGVVHGLRFGPDSEPGPQAYLPSRSPRALTIVARVEGRARDRVAAVRDAAQSVDAKVPVFNVKTMEERMESALARPKFYTIAVAFFGVVGLLIAVIGVYGTVAYAVVQRTREMGIRLALGTTPARLRGLFLRQMLIVVAASAAIGLVLAVISGRFLQSLVSGARESSVSTLSLTLAGVVLFSAAAVWTATRQVARLDITDVLRADSAD